MSAKRSTGSAKAAKKEVPEVAPAYPPLYKVNNNNKLYEWTIEIRPVAEGGDGGAYEIITRNGEKDGRKVEHKSTVFEGKVNRTVLEQAILEANSKFKSKREKELYQETIPQVGVEEAAAGAGAGTVVSVRPMLAKTFEFEAYAKKGKAYRIPFPAFVQRKYDGIRCLAYLDRVSGEVVLESREGKRFENFAELRGQIHAFLTQIGQAVPTFYLDGELFTNEIPFEEISGCVRLSAKHAKPVDLEKIRKIHLHIYDYIDLRQMEAGVEERLRNLQGWISVAPQPFLHLTETETVHALEEVRTKHDQYVAEGFEGIMIRDPAGKYEVDKRSKFLQKYKDFQEEEFKIMGFHEEEGGLVIWDCLLPDGSTVGVRPRGSVEYRRDLFQNGHSHIGKLLTIRYQGYTSEGSLRFPVGKAIRDGY
jgi:ATP-dependent DNA ligase